MFPWQARAVARLHHQVALDVAEDRVVTVVGVAAVEEVVAVVAVLGDGAVVLVKGEVVMDAEDVAAVRAGQSRWQTILAGKLSSLLVGARRAMRVGFFESRFIGS